MSVTAPNGAVTLTTGVRIGDWEVAGLLGSGGSASVYRAIAVEAPPASKTPASTTPASTSAQHGLDRPPTARPSNNAVALRICLPTDERHLQAIVSTYRSAPTHPNVAAVHDVFVEPIGGHDHVVCITELSNDETLAERIDELVLTAGEGRELAAQLLGALDAYHSQGLVHGDVKPANIMRFGQQWKLVDPSATEGRGAEAGTSTVVTHERTFRYVAPEMLDTPGRTKRSADVWALGVTLHEALTREPPFASISDQVIANPAIDPAIPPDLATVIEHCVAPIDERPRTADAVRAMPVTADRRRVLPSAPWLAATAAVLVIVGLGLWWALSGPDRPQAGVDPGPETGVEGLDVTTLEATTQATETVGAEASLPSPGPTASGQETADETLDTTLDSPVSSTSTSAPTSAPASTTPAATAPSSPDETGSVVVASDFEAGGTPVVFAQPVAGELPEPVADNGGQVLQVSTNNRAQRLYLAAAGGNALSGGAIVTAEADVRMAYFRGPDGLALGPLHGFLLKELPNGDAYAVTVFPNQTGVSIRLGVLSGEGAAGTEAYNFADEAAGHRRFEDRLVFPQPFDVDQTKTELGYWTLSAGLRTEGDSVVLTATLTSPSGAAETVDWVDTGPGAYGGPGRIGLVSYGIWSIENRYDNLVVTLP